MKSMVQRLIISILGCMVILIEAMLVDAVEYSTTPADTTFVEPGSTITLLWRFSNSYTLVETSFGTGSKNGFTIGFITVLPNNQVTVAGNIPVAYQGRVTFTGDVATGTLQFQLRNVSNSDANKFYGCKTFVDPGTVQVTWKPTNLQILVAPKFSSVPAVPGSVKEGNPLSIPCSTSEGNPTPVVSWMKGAVNVSSGWGTADLNFTSLTRQNSGSYECVATNRKTTIRHSIQLDVLFKPEQIQLKSNASGSVAISGDYVLFTCTVGAANPAVSHYRFYNESTLLSSPSKGEYLIRNIQYSDQGSYKCIPHNDAGDGIEAILSITVKEPAKITSSPSATIIVNEGQPVPLVCTATGHPTPTLAWTKDGNAFGNREDVTIIKSTRNSKGVYTCTATNGVKEDKTSTTTVTVHYKPDIDTGLSNSTVGSWNNNVMTLQCVARGVPTPAFSWFKPGGQKITTNIVSMTDGSRVTVTTSAPGDYGQYKCRATNGVGSTDHNITVKQWTKPGKPLEVTLKEIQASYIKLAWAPPANDGGSRVIDYKIEIQKNTDAKPKVFDDEVTATERLIDQLTPGASYSAWVYARNIVGFGDVALTPFSTKTQGKPGIPMLNDVNTKISTTNVELTWSAAAENGGEILTYTVWWREVDKSGGVGKWFSRNTSSIAVTYTVPELKFGKIYQFGITAWNKYGQSVLDKENGLKQVEVIEPTAAAPGAPGESSDVNVAAIGGGAAAAVIILVVVVVIVVVLKRRKASPGKAGESRDPLGGSGDEGYMSVSKASAASRLGRNNANNEEAGIPTYATVDMSKKTPKKPDLIYAELADFNNSAARAASMNRREQPKGYEPTDYAEIAQFGRPSAEPMYDNVPRY